MATLNDLSRPEEYHPQRHSYDIHANSTQSNKNTQYNHSNNDGVEGNDDDDDYYDDDNDHGQRSYLTSQQRKLISDPPVLSSVTMVNIPYRWLVYPQVGSIFFAMFGSLIWALIYDFDEVVQTHCHDAKQFFPSFSAVIGNGFPEMFIWRIGLMILIPIRMIQGLIFHWAFSHKQLYYQPGGRGGQHTTSSSFFGDNNSPQSPQQSYELASLSDNGFNSSASSIDIHNNNNNNKKKKKSTNNPTFNANKKPSQYPKFNKPTKPIPPHNSQLPPDPSLIGPSNPNQRAISIGHQHVSTIRYITGLMHTITLWIEYGGLAMLTYVSSTEHFASHAGGFVIFIIASQIHTIFNLILTRNNFRLKGAIFKVQITKVFLWLINLCSIYSCYYFYVLHNATCSNYIYSFFGLSEYTLVTSNIFLHVINLLEHSWQGTFSFTLVIPSFALNCHPDNYDILKRCGEDEADWLNYGQVDVPVVGDGHYTEDELDHFDLVALTHDNNNDNEDSIRNCLDDNVYGGVRDKHSIDPVGPDWGRSKAAKQQKQQQQQHPNAPSSTYISSIRQNPAETDSDIDLDNGF